MPPRPPALPCFAVTASLLLGCPDAPSLAGDIDVTIQETGGSTLLHEGGSGDDYRLSLTDDPGTSVTLTLGTDGECLTAPAQLAFSPDDWDTPRTVALSAVDDVRWEDEHRCTVQHLLQAPGGPVIPLTGLEATVIDDIEVIDPADWFLLGVNYPWFHYGHDFGECAWGYDGVTTTRADVDAEFTEIAGAGARVVRWFILADGRAGIEFDDGGTPTGLDSRVFDDLDAALELAVQHGLFLVPVLLDFYWFAAAETEDGVQLGGHADAITDDDRRQALLDDVLAPLLQRYGSHPRILAWDIVNEPEWAMDYYGLLWLGGGAPAQTVVEFVEQVAALIHEHTWHLATLGSADLDWMLQYWAGSSLDLLQFHYYDDEPFLIDADTLGLGHAPVVGEFPTQDAPQSLTQTLDQIHALGHGGAWPWAYADTDRTSELDLAELRAWADAHADEVDVQLTP